MEKWDFWDWLAYLPILVVALVLAAEGAAGLAPALEARRPKFSKGSFWKLYPLLMLGVSACVFLYKCSVDEDILNQHVILQWGGSGMEYAVNDGKGLRLEGPNSSIMVVDSNKIYRRYSKGMYIIGVCFHHDKSGDVLDSPQISKSSPYDIVRENVTIKIPWNELFMNQVLSGEVGTNYRVLVVPNDVKEDQFSTLREAFSLGALDVGHVGGPP